jgi:uncharacterized protein YndB with AHSA1/START domain
MKAIRQTYIIDAPIEKVWDALINPKIIDEWGGGPSKMKDEEGFEFSLWEGTIWGKNLEVKLHQRLVQDWYSDEDPKWEKPSKVTFELSEEEHGTRLDLLHEDIPDQDVKNISQGWEDYYLGPLKAYLESE